MGLFTGKDLTGNHKLSSGHTETNDGSPVVLITGEVLTHNHESSGGHTDPMGSAVELITGRNLRSNHESSGDQIDPNEGFAVRLTTGKDLTGNYESSGGHIDPNEGSTVGPITGKNLANNHESSGSQSDPKEGYAVRLNHGKDLTGSHESSGGHTDLCESSAVGLITGRILAGNHESSRGHIDPNEGSAVGLMTGKGLASNHRSSGSHIDLYKSSDVELITGKDLTGNHKSSGGHTYPNEHSPVGTISGKDLTENHDTLVASTSDPDDLYLPIWHSKNAKRDKMKAADHIPVFQLWRSQVSAAFGFIPLSPLVGNKDWEANEYIECPLLAHEKVKASGKYNFQEAKIHIPSQLKTENWQKYLSQYWDWQLISFLKFGFPLDFNENVQLKCDHTNHKSAILYPDHVDKYISEEKHFKAIHGSFKTAPFSDMQCSPFITREKPGGNKRRVIVDLSWPAGNAVNDGPGLLFRH